MKRLFHRTHEALNAAFPHLHDPLAKSSPHESQQRAYLVESCIQVLTSLGFLVHYPEGSETIRELVEKQEQPKTRTEKPTGASRVLPTSSLWDPPAVSNNPHTRSVKF